MSEKVHEVESTMNVEFYFPDHAPRKITPTFRKTRKKLLVENKETCFICGTDKNLEAHHYYVEWAMSNAVDWEKMKKLHREFDWNNFKKPEDFVDSVYNMMILCEKHHRQTNTRNSQFTISTLDNAEIRQRRF
jgi:pterin-4a-carbinolamine dehydratase